MFGFVAPSGTSFPQLFSTVTVPKSDELVAPPARHGGQKEAEEFFLTGMEKTLAGLHDSGHPAFPITIYYAFKQSDTGGDEDVSSTGWQAFWAQSLAPDLPLQELGPFEQRALEECVRMTATR